MSNDFDALFKGMDTYVKTMTVFGDPVRIDDATIVPVMELSFGMASGAFNQGSSNAGAMSAKMTPVALFVHQNGVSRMMQINNSDAISKAIDLIPDFVNKISGKGIAKDIQEKAQKMAENSKPDIDLM